jgi:hypothetical protein
MGRKPSQNPKSAHVGFRVEGELLKLIDAEVARRARLSGVELDRSKVVRAIVREALTKS